MEQVVMSYIDFTLKSFFLLDCLGCVLLLLFPGRNTKYRERTQMKSADFEHCAQKKYKNFLKRLAGMKTKMEEMEGRTRGF